MADATMLARRQVRLAVMAALASDLLAGVNIYSPGDWNTPPEAMPALLMRVADERKESKQKGQPEFDTMVGVEMALRVSAPTAAGAQDALEALCYAVEMAVLTNHDLIKLLQQVASIDTVPEFSASGKLHFGGAVMKFGFEVFEAFDPFVVVAPVPLTSFGLHFDACAPFDATGTYENTLFPGLPAPRTSGPDGRDEAALDFTLPQ